MTRPGFALIFLLATALGGCASLSGLSQATKPSNLYALTPKSTFSKNLPRLSQQIVVEEPTATAAVNTDRIAVQPNVFEVQYLPRSRWVDRAPLIIQALMIESYENTGKVAAVGRSAVGLRSDYNVITDLREFQAFQVSDEPGDDSLRVVVRLNIKLVDAVEDTILASRSFEEVAISADDDPLTLVTAFDQALGNAMKDSVEWSIRTIHSYARNNPSSF
ncbi:ABC-type transport auxiliary lipoprotein family protein [Ruegeria hyattellae]|uniref:ABC-type transport auxiliary lipoprotein family protein n=1 Tax=Ruegeria hyattellae TaxID=3233337 RepID=UPI00355B8466